MRNDIHISVEDIKYLYRKQQKRFKNILFLTFFLLLFFLLLTPPSYKASATFKQSSSLQTQQGFDVQQLMRSFSNSGFEGATIPIISSKRVIGKVVESLGLQVAVSSTSFLKDKWNNIKNNFSPTLKPPLEQLFQDIHYEGEKPQYYYLRFLTQELFEVLSMKKKPLLRARLREPLSFQGVTFTVCRAPSQVNKLYPFALLPKNEVVEKYKKRIAITPLREERNILSIQFFDSDRHQAALFINTLMKKYEEFLLEETQVALGSQLAYLEKRREELHQKLDIEMKNHVALFKNNLKTRGLMGIEEELKLIFKPLQVHKNRLDKIEVQIATLEKGMPWENPDTTLFPLAEQMDKNLSQKIQDALMKGLRPTLHSHQERISQLLSRQKSLKKHIDYVNLLENDFRGLPLEAIQELFQQYSHQLDQLHSQMKQLLFFKNHLHEPHFEINALSNLLSDTVTEQLVKKSSELEAQLCDSLHRSEKEHQRLHEALSIHKRFLDSHLHQTLKLAKIRMQLIKEKIVSLHQTIKTLLYKEKTILEKKITAITKNLEEIPELWRLEKGLHLKGKLIKGMMQGLSEIAESKNLSRHLYQVESKPLDKAVVPTTIYPRYLFLKSLGGSLLFTGLFFLAYLIYYFIKGLPLSLTTLAHMGACTAGIFSPTISSSFEGLSGCDLKVLRSITSFLLERKEAKGGTIVSLLGETGAPFYVNLARLLTLYQQKVGVIDCSLDRLVFPENQPGLWDYLHGSFEEIPLRQKNQYDFIPAGKMVDHTIEILSSNRFALLLRECRHRYDFTFLLRQASLLSQETRQSLQQSDLSIVTITEASQATLTPFLQWSARKEKGGVIFVQMEQ